jgi:glycosyltransferase involved in cell wall biosynthesis
MKKVLFVATVVKLHMMVFHIPYLEFFKKNGYEVHVSARNDYDNKEECIIPFCDKFYDLPFERSPIRKNNLLVYKDLKNIVDTEVYEIIHCHTPMGGALGRLAAHSARKKGTKVVYTSHGFHFFKGAPLINWFAYYPVERWLARYTDVLITINKEDYEFAKKFKANRIEYVPGVGIDTDKFKTVVTDRELKRSELGLTKHAIVVLSVGELNKNKNHEIVIRAIGKINNPDINYIICGQGKLYGYLKSLSKELGIENQVHLLGFRNDIPEICKMADLFVFPSHREGLSVALMEAMASGLPVVCSNIRGNSDLIEDGKGGYLVKPGDVEGFAKYIDKFITDGEIGVDFGKLNHKIIEDYSIEYVLKIMEDIYFNYEEVDKIESVTYNK